MNDVRNVFCVGRNYRLHAAELGNAVPKNPMLFMKPTHALFTMDGSQLQLPSTFGEIHYEAELVVRIGKTYTEGVQADELVNGFALGIDFTLRQLQTELKQRQHPWLKAKGFLHSAPITPFQPITQLSELAETSFSLNVNGQERQRGHISEMIFDIQTLIDAVGQHYGLDEGDIIFTGTPSGVGEVKNNDKFELYWGEERLGSCSVLI